jgi:hypothetical protein
MKKWLSLIESGSLQRTPQGHVLTSKAWQLFGVEQKLLSDHDKKKRFRCLKGLFF